MRLHPSVALLLFFSLGCQSKVALLRPRVNTSLGTNLGPVTDWSSEWAFVDVMKLSRSWTSGTESNWDDKRPIDLDGNGWVRSLAPGQIVRTLIFYGDGAHNLGGRYLVLYDGKGTLRYGGATRDDAASTPGREVVTLAASQRVNLDLLAVDAADPLRNLRIISPGGVCSDDAFRYCDEQNACAKGSCDSFEQNYATQIFHPKFLATIRNYRAIRLGNWSDVSDPVPLSGRWTDRPLLTHARWTEKGVPLEVQIELANRLGADPWFGIPHLADDDYVTHWAELVRDRLRSDLKAYIEYSNEVWNDLFEQEHYAKMQGLALGLSSDPIEARSRFYSRRAVEIFKIWERVFGGSARLQRILSAFETVPEWSEQILGYADAPMHTDALAIGHYFWATVGFATNTTTLDALFADLRDHGIPEIEGFEARNAAIAKKHGVALVAYEGGQSLLVEGPNANDPVINALYDAANRDPRMGQLYAQMLAGWRANGGALFLHYLNCWPTTNGRWGSLEYLDQPRAEAPKYDALQSFIETVPRWW